MRRSNESQQELGEALREMRTERGSTQRAIATEAGISLAHYCAIEAGRSNPTWGAMRRVAAALGTDIGELGLRANARTAV